MIKILEISDFWDMLNFGQLRCLLELGGSPYLSEFEQTSEMRNSQGTRGTREPPGFLQAAPLRCFFFLPPFYIAGPLSPQASPRSAVLRTTLSPEPKPARSGPSYPRLFRYVPPAEPGCLVGFFA